MEDEHDPLGRLQLLEHHQQGEADPVVQRGAVGRVDGRARVGRRAGELDRGGVVGKLAPGTGPS